MQQNLYVSCSFAKFLKRFAYSCHFVYKQIRSKSSPLKQRASDTHILLVLVFFGIAIKLFRYFSSESRMSHGARNSAKKSRQVTRKVTFSLEEQYDKGDCQKLFKPKVPLVPLTLYDSNGEPLRGVNLYLSNVKLPIDDVPDETEFFKKGLAEKASKAAEKAEKASTPLLPEFSEEPKVVYYKTKFIQRVFDKATFFITEKLQAMNFGSK